MSTSNRSNQSTVAIVLGLSLLALVPWLGCTGSSNSAPSAAGAKVLLDAEPADVSGLVDLKSSLITGIAPMDGESAIEGRVVSGQDWEPNSAMFLVRDLQADTEHTHDHGDGDHSECAFCQAKEKQTGAMALIQVVDDQGHTISMDARKLLGVEESQIVVAQGSPTIDEDGTLVFAASKIFIRK